MTDSKPNRVPVKIAESAMNSLRDRAYEIRKATGKEPTLASLLDEAVQAFVSPGSDVSIPTEAAPPSSVSSPELELFRMYLERFPKSAHRMIGQMEFQLETTLEKLQDEAKEKRPGKGRKSA